MCVCLYVNTRAGSDALCYTSQDVFRQDPENSLMKQSETL